MLCFKHHFSAISILVLALICVANAGTIRSTAIGTSSSSPSNERELKLAFANEYTAKVNKTEYVVGEPIGLTQVSNTGIIGNTSRWLIVILPEKDLQLVENPFTYFATSFSKQIPFNNGTVVKYDLTWPRNKNAYYSLLGDGVDYDTTEARARTNITLPNQTVLDTKLVIVTLEEDFSAPLIGRLLKVVSVSNAFKFKLNFINIKLDKSTYKPGETLKLDYTKQSYANPQVPKEYTYYEYLKIFKVQSSNTGTPLKFNNSTITKYQYLGNVPLSQTLDRQLITWTEPGKYQAVLLQAPQEIILGTSAVFEVRKPNTAKNVSVVMDNTTYYPFQDILFTIKADRELSGRQVTFSFAHANATAKDFSDSTKIIDTTTRIWSYAKKKVAFSYASPIVHPGSYKVGVTISIGPGDDYTLFITKPFTILQPSLSVVSNPPETEFVLGGLYYLYINNPNNFQFNDQSDYTNGYSIAVVNAGFPSTGPIVGPSFLQNFYPFNMYFPPGQYEFALFRRTNGYGLFGREYLYTLPNSTFTVSQNIATVTTDKTQYKFGDEIVITLSTARNVLLGMFLPSPSHQLKLIRSTSPNVTETLPEKRDFDTRMDNNLLGRRIVAFRTTGVFTIVVQYTSGPSQINEWAESKQFTITS